MPNYLKDLTKLEFEKIISSLDLLKSQTKSLTEKDRIAGTQNKIKQYIDYAWRRKE